MEGGLPGREAQRSVTALEQRDPLFQDVGRRIADAAVAEAFDLQVEERRTVIGTVERVGCRLIDGDRDRVGRRIVVEPTVDGDRLALHGPVPIPAWRACG